MEPEQKPEILTEIPPEQPKPGQIPEEHVRLPEESSPAETHEADHLPKLRTMKHDAARYLKDRNISFLDLVAKEHEYAQEHPEKFKYKERVTEQIWFRGVLGFVSVVILAALGYGVYVFLLTRNTLPSPEASPARAFISVEEREVITIREKDRAGLLSKLEAARRNRLPSRSIKHVVIRIESFGGGSRFASAGDFFRTLDYKTPSGFTDNLNDKFDVLVYYRSDGADLGFIFEPKDSARSLGQMLGWENSIILDFRNLYFDKNVSQPLHLFTDTIVRNIDVRSIALPENAVFSYSIFAQRFLVIALSSESMDTLLGRLLAAPPR